MPLDGLQFGRYRLLRLLGVGGMGEVYLAEDTCISRQVAIKVIKNDGMASPDTVNVNNANRLFLREVRAIAALQHPYILPLFDFGDSTIDESTLSYMVMPYCQDGSLENWLRRKGSFHLSSFHLIAHILEQAADALQYAHDKRIIHQDVKLSNFLIHRWKVQGVPDLLLADFGIAKFLSANSHTSQSIRGTPTSMAPEQWEGHPVAATDQYALAVMIYQLLTGQPPFQGGPGQNMYQHLTVQPQPPSTRQPGISSSIDAVMLRALMKKPQERFENVLAFAQAFKQALPAPSDLENMQRNVHGNDLVITLALSTEEAVSGTNRTLLLPDGQNIRLTIPPGVHTGQTLHLEALSEQSGSATIVHMLVVTIIVTQLDDELAAPQKIDEVTTLRPSAVVSDRKSEVTLPPDNNTITSTPHNTLGGLPHTFSSDIVPIYSTDRWASGKEQLIQRHRKLVRGKGILLTLLVFILIAGSVGIPLYLVRTPSQSIPTRSVIATIRATQSNHDTNATATQLTTEEHATATTHAQVQDMTATVQASLSNPYPPHSGTLALNDPLSGNTQGYQWEEGTRDQGTCTFTGGGYQSAIALAGFFHSCLALSTDFSDFTYEVRMMLISGSAGGIVFRADRATTHLYYFTVDRSGGYLLKKYYDKVGDATVIAKGSGVSFNETALIGVVAQGSTINLYVNQQLVQQMHDGTFLHGQMGVVVYQGKALFSNAKVWRL